VDREPTFPHRDDLRGVLAVIVPVEDHLVEPCADESREDRPLRRADDVVGGQPFLPCARVPEPEPGEDGGGHEDAVPPDDDGADLEGDGAGRGEHVS
jgi:hypothetical protein